MKNVKISYNPYRLKTTITVDGRNPGEYVSRLVKDGKRLQEWAVALPEALYKDIYDDYSIEFVGMALDYDDLKESFDTARKNKIIKDVNFTFNETLSGEEIKKSILDIFDDLMDESNPVTSIRENKQIINALERLNDARFPVNVIATMSSGKSTLINALLGKELMPAKNQACTALVTEIIDNDKEPFIARAFNNNDELTEEIDELTYDIMDRLNSTKDIKTIIAEGIIPFLDANNMRLNLIDTPGPNNSQDPSHERRTHDIIQGGSDNLILYVLNATQLSTNDDQKLLEEIAKKIKEGGKQARDRFLFVINKMDEFDPDSESVEGAVEDARKYLTKFGIEDPQIFPCSARTALFIRTKFNEISYDEIDNMSRAELKKLPQAVRDAVNDIDRFNEYEELHLERFSVLSPSSQRILNEELLNAADDPKEKALIHSGIRSIEEAIKAYVKKYAMTKMIKDLVEQLEAVLETNKVVTDLKSEIVKSSQKYEEFKNKKTIVEAEIRSGKESEKLKDRIDLLNPMPEIKKSAEDASRDAQISISDWLADRIEPGKVYNSKAEIDEIVEGFNGKVIEILVPVDAIIKNRINTVIIAEGRKMVEEYRGYLSAIDKKADSDSEAGSNARSEDFIRDKLNDLEVGISDIDSISDDWKSDDVMEYKEETRKVIDGYERKKVGTKRVKVGTEEYKIKVGTEKVWAGTKKVKNPERTGLGILAFWKPLKVDEDIYIEQDVYETKYKDKYETKDVFENVEKSHMETRTVAYVTADKLHVILDKRFVERIEKKAIPDYLKVAEEKISAIKSYFKKSFEEMDKLLVKKYEEIEEYGAGIENAEAALKANREILNFIEGNLNEIHELIDEMRVKEAV